MIQSSRARLDQLSFEPGSKATMQEQVYARIREAIADGRLSFGERLPSTRSLSAQLNVARGTIDAAYGRLAAEGFIVGKGAAGTVVATDPHAEPRRSAPRPPPSPAAPNDHLWPFRGGLPALDLFPRARWTGLATRTAKRLDATRLCYPEPQGLHDLRAAIVAYLLVSRGVDCDTSQVFITSGYQAALNHTLGMVLRPADEVWFEDPGYRFARRSLEAAQARMAPIPIDAAGVDIDYARQRHPAARLAIVTPGHQSPLGMSLTLQRRQALLDWASDADAWVLEDDYDSEFHYVGRKPPALKSIDRRDRVFYAGSFSKTLFPGLRLGYLVVPAPWIDKARIASELWGRGHSTLEQAVVAAFMADGHFARHLRSMRLRYAERSAALTQALVQRFGDEIRLTPPEGGLTLLARFSGLGPDTELVDRARARGLAPAALSTHATQHDVGYGLLLGFTNIKPEQAADAAERLHQAISEGSNGP
jgi:GntR family transcriptional regulator/MocR family aminotransferase